MASFRQSLSSKALAPVFSIAAAAAAAFVKYPPSEDRSLNNDHGKRQLMQNLYYSFQVWPRPGTTNYHHAGVASCDAAAPKLNAKARGLDSADRSDALSMQGQLYSGLDEDAMGNNNKPTEGERGLRVTTSSEGFQADAVGTFHGMFPARQLFQPAMPYPLWNSNWDGRQPEATDDPQADKQRMRTIRKNGTTRHIILIRHGQYDETHRVRHHR